MVSTVNTVLVESRDGMQEKHNDAISTSKQEGRVLKFMVKSKLEIRAFQNNPSLFQNEIQNDESTAAFYFDPIRLQSANSRSRLKSAY